MTLGVDDEGIIVYVDVDVLLIKARQIGRQHQLVAFVLNIGTERCQRVRCEDAAFKVFQFTEGVIHSCFIIVLTIRCEIQHNQFLQFRLPTVPRGSFISFFWLYYPAGL